VGLAVTLAVLVATLAWIPPAHANGVRFLDEVFAGITTIKDAVYGHAVDSQGVRRALTLDVHQPAGDTATTRPAVVWIHGGYFTRGSKEDYPDVWRQFARAGYVTASINYRLDPTIPESAADIVAANRLDDYFHEVRDAQHDAQAAIRWLRANAAAFRVDPARIAVAGHSAGGIITNAVAFNEEDPGSSGNPGYPSRVAAAVAMSGGAVPTKTVTVGANEPPLLVVHGLADATVPYAVAAPACALTILRGNVCEQVLDPDAGHVPLALPAVREFLYRRIFHPSGTVSPTRLKIVRTHPL
jgi:dienelactone hydrolase